MMISDRSLKRLLRSDERVALWGDLLRAIAAAFLLVGIAAGVMYHAALAKVMFNELHMNDFGKFYYSTRAFLDGRDMYGPNLATAIPISERITGQFANMNPPHFHLLLLPLARLSPLNAMLVWSAVSALCLIASVRVISRELSIRWTPSRAAWGVFGALMFSGTAMMVLTGQVSFLLMLPFALAWKEARHNRWHRAAIWLGLLTSLKPFFGVFLLYLWARRQWRASITMAVTIAGCFLLGLAIFGPTRYVDWLHALSSVNWVWGWMNASVQSLITRALATTPVFVPLVHAGPVVPFASIAAAASILITSLTVCALDREEGSMDRGFAVMLTAALLASPLGWMYYNWLLIGPVAATWQERSRDVSSSRKILLVLVMGGLFMPIFFTGILRDSRWGGVTFGSINAWTMLELWALLIMDWRAHRRSATAFSAAS